MMDHSTTLRSHIDWWFELQCRCEPGRHVQVALQRLCQEISAERTIVSVASMLRCQHCHNRPKAIVLLREASLRSPITPPTAQKQSGILVYGFETPEIAAIP